MESVHNKYIQITFFLDIYIYIYIFFFSPFCEYFVEYIKWQNTGSTKRGDDTLTLWTYVKFDYQKKDIWKNYKNKTEKIWRLINE